MKHYTFSKILIATLVLLTTLVSTGNASGANAVKAFPGAGSSSSQGDPSSLNLINNLYIRGPMTSKSTAFYVWMPKVEEGGSLHYGRCMSRAM